MKTLTSIALIYCALAHKVCAKAVVVCPSSLVTNWGNEFKKWLRMQLSTEAKAGLGRVVVAGTGGANASCEEKLDDFLKFKAPVLVISYDSYRKFAERINSLNTIGLLVCDEGHKLKKQGSKTMDALSGCPALKRVLLTGTPVQNDLGTGPWGI